MNWIKTSLLISIAVIVKVGTVLGLNKLLAVYVGPIGYVILGQFQNSMTIITTLANGAINTSVTKYTAEYFQNETLQHTIWRTAGTISLGSSLLISVLIVIFREELAGWFLGDKTFSSVFLWLAAFLIFLVFNTLVVAILNGKKEYSSYVSISIFGSIFVFIITSLLVIGYGLYGALVAFAINQSLVLLVTLIFVYKKKWFSFRYLFGAIDKKATKNLTKFALMSFTSAMCIPLSLIFIREHLIVSFGNEAAGYWEAMWRLSSMYLLVITSALGIYYLPRYSELMKTKEIKLEIKQAYKFIIPLVILFGLGLYFLRDFIIVTLFTTNFSPMRNLFGWQITGDILKIASCILGYVFVSKAAFSINIFIEVFFSFTFFLWAHLLVNKFGLIGASIAYAVNNLCCLVFVGIKINRFMEYYPKNPAIVA